MLALVALAIQFAVAFGHVHLPKNLTSIGPAMVAASITLDGAAAGPAGKDHPAADVFCDVCATLSLTAHAQAAPSPAIVPPAFTSIVQVSAPVDDVPVQRRYLLAQCRAPPAV